MTNNTRLLVSVSFILAAIGFLLPLWPLCVAGVALLALSGRYVFALGIGVLLDLAYGAPAGRYAWALFPFTIAAVALCIARYVGSSYLIDKDLPHSL